MAGARKLNRGTRHAGVPLFQPAVCPEPAWAAFDWQTFPAAPLNYPPCPRQAIPCLSLARQMPLWINCRPDWLQTRVSRVYSETGRDQAILAFAEGTADDKGVMPPASSCARWLAPGADDHRQQHSQKLTISSFDHLVFDIDHARNGVPLIDLINAHQYGFQLAARNVVSHEQFDWAVAKRFHCSPASA